MNSEVTISAIITTHNRCDLLKRAIDSATSQTIASKEVIVVDDASTDATQQMVCAMPNVTYIRIEPGESRGGNHTRNIGLNAARGKYVAFLDDDDYWKPNKLELQVAEAERNGAGVVFCGMTREIIAKDGSVSYTDDPPRSKNAWPYDMRREIFCAIPTVTSCVVANRKLVHEVGGFDESLKAWQEYELLIRLAQKTKFSRVGSSLVVYRQDCRDKQRVSNRYFAWRQTLRQVEAKHRTLLDSLPWRIRLRWSINVGIDATDRARNAGIPIRCALIWTKTLFLRILNKFLKVFGKLSNG